METPRRRAARRLRWVLLHQEPFGVVELAGLVEYLGGDHQLADVVQQRADAEPEEGHGVPTADARPDGARKVRDSHAMALRVHVLRFDGLAPFSRDVEEVGLEECGAAVDVRQARAERAAGERGGAPGSAAGGSPCFGRCQRYSSASSFAVSAWRMRSRRSTPIVSALRKWPDFFTSSVGVARRTGVSGPRRHRRRCHLFG